MKPAAVPPLVAISDRRSLTATGDAVDGGWRDWLRALVADGVPALQLREKDLDDRALFDLAAEARRWLPPPFLLLVNGRADVALAAGADGVHLPADGLPVAALARFAAERTLPDGRRLLVGRSTHAPAEVAAARHAAADYAIFGPVWPTPGKRRYGPPPGLDALAAACALGLPVVALGGVTTPERVAAAAAAGAAGVAGIRAFQDPGRRRELVAASRDAFPTAAPSAGGHPPAGV